jgi:hypothetical protein
MKKTIDILAGEVIGTILINDKRIEPHYSKTSTFFYGVCQNCNAEVRLTASHARMILDGRGSGCHCGRRRSDPDSDYKWRYQSYAQAAKKRNLSFNLSYDLFLEITQSRCYYCDAEPEMRPSHHKRWDFKFPMSGIDRVDSRKGYEKDNVVPCCTHCNRAKWDYDREDFLLWIKKVYNHQFRRETNESN